VNLSSPLLSIPHLWPHLFTLLIYCLWDLLVMTIMLSPFLCIFYILFSFFCTVLYLRFQTATVNHYLYTYTQTSFIYVNSYANWFHMTFPLMLDFWETMNCVTEFLVFGM
jgi:hypothetical protein